MVNKIKLTIGIISTSFSIFLIAAGLYFLGLGYDGFLSAESY